MVVIESGHIRCHGCGAPIDLCTAVTGDSSAFSMISPVQSDTWFGAVIDSSGASMIWACSESCATLLVELGGRK